MSIVHPKVSTFQHRDMQVLSTLRLNSHTYKVYMYLRDEGTLTVQDSIEKWGKGALTSVVQRLQQYGAIIENINVDVDGKRLVNYACYSLVID